MKDGKRLYINLTNKCNTECPFCCMYSNERNSRFITFEQYKKIIDSTKQSFELQLEGGEPLLHPKIFDIIKRKADTLTFDVPQDVIDNAINQAEEEQGFQYTTEQNYVIRQSLQRSVSFITARKLRKSSSRWKNYWQY